MIIHTVFLGRVMKAEWEMKCIFQNFRVFFFLFAGYNMYCILHSSESMVRLCMMIFLMSLTMIYCLENVRLCVFFVYFCIFYKVISFFPTQLNYFAWELLEKQFSQSLVCKSIQKHENFLCSVISLFFLWNFTFQI